MELKEFEKMANFEQKYWWWVGKRNIVKGILNKLNLDNPNILDVGCGTGFNLTYLQDYGTTTGLDFSNDALKFCRKLGKNRLIQADAEILPIKEETFDVLTTLDCLEHLDDTKCIKEIHRIMKPNSYLIVTVPAFQFIWSRHDDALHHKRRYNKKQLKGLLEKNGFKVIKMSYWNFFLFIPIVSIRLIKKNFKTNGKIETDVNILPTILNRILTLFLTFESHLISHSNLPIGISLVCIGKPNK